MNSAVSTTYVHAYTPVGLPRLELRVPGIRAHLLGPRAWRGMRAVGPTKVGGRGGAREPGGEGGKRERERGKEIQ